MVEQGPCDAGVLLRLLHTEVILAIADVRTGRLAPRTHRARALPLLETMLQEDRPGVLRVRMPLEALLGPCQLPVQELHHLQRHARAHVPDELVLEVPLQQLG